MGYITYRSIHIYLFLCCLKGITDQLNTSNITTKTTQRYVDQTAEFLNGNLAWLVAGLGLLLAAALFTCLLHYKIKNSTCWRCTREHVLLNFRGVDLASTYTSPGETDPGYAKIDDTHLHRHRDGNSSTVDYQTIHQSDQSLRFPTSSVRPSDDYLHPRVSVPLDNVTDDYRVSRLSDMFRTSFWNRDDGDQYINPVEHPPGSNRSRTRTKTRLESVQRETDVPRKEHRNRCGGVILSEEEETDRVYTIFEGEGDSEIDVVNDPIQPHRFDAEQRMDDHRGIRLSRSYTELSTINNENYCERRSLHLENENEHLYAVVHEGKKQPPIPKRRKSIPRRDIASPYKIVDIYPEATVSKKSKTIQCPYEKRVRTKPNCPTPLPRSKSLNRPSRHCNGILKNSNNRPRNRAHTSALSTPMEESLISRYENQLSLNDRSKISGDGSLKRTVLRLGNVAKLDGPAKSRKEYINVRIVVKDLSCSTDNIGLDSEFWNS